LRPFCFRGAVGIGGRGRPPHIHLPSRFRKDPHPWWLFLPMRRADQLTFSTPLEGICILGEIALLFRVNGGLGNSSFVSFIRAICLERLLTVGARGRGNSSSSNPLILH
jgi:hypothetical protein